MNRKDQKNVAGVLLDIQDRLAKLERGGNSMPEEILEATDEVKSTDVLIRVVNKSKNDLPVQATSGSAGMDLRASLKRGLTIKPGERKLIPTDLFIALPEGYEFQVRPRSGLALKEGITVLNTPGTVDSDYRGNVGVILINLSDKDFKVKSGDRIAQGVVAKYETVVWAEVEELDETERGEGGFNSTGKE